jgi:SAM-dependent methyltransferase
MAGAFRVVVCRACGMVYLNPRPTAEALAAYYPAGNYYSYHQAAVGKGSGAARRAKDALKALLTATYLGYDERAPRWVPRTRWARGALRLLLTPLKDRVCALLPPRGWGGTILDVGCGSGISLDWAREFGWATHGVEISEGAVESARERGHAVVLGQLEEAKYPDGTFDVVRAWHSLEHLPHPAQSLREMHRILKPGGRLWVEVPNVGSFLGATFRGRWFHLDPPRHLQNFSPATLRRMLAEAGFAEPSLYAHQAPRSLASSLLYVVDDLPVRLPARVRSALGTVLGLALIPLSWLLTLLSRGDVIRAVARRRTDRAPTR